MEEQKIIKVVFNKSGGNASKNSTAGKLLLPKAWLKEMGITPEDREVSVTFQDEKIIIEKKKEGV